ncbi:MAG: hypothetical protein K9N47_12705 [Prosthecobacter sp.]|uniref:hypothetical protein n=1 Tax=Prosthecobacter sp. TaxID=1965333 RepID=UPI0025ED2CA9|nr:hypothetical protein [Prosthecobacter sp.]MCF7786978.1 hypothetical protein [Prosthecobacter sp.]
MKGRRYFSVLCAVILVGGQTYAVWWSAIKHQHRIIILLPDGTPAPTPSVVLDYDPVYEYHPMLLTGDQLGIVFIPRERAYGQGWDTMRISATQGAKWYVASRDPLHCHYPMTVVLEEAAPQPKAGLFQQLRELIQVLRQ